MSQETGEVIETHGEVSVRWTFSDLQKLSSKASECYLSPVIYFADSCWKLKLRPHQVDNRFFYLGLLRDDFGPSKTVNFHLGIEIPSETGLSHRFSERGSVYETCYRLDASLDTHTAFCTLKNKEKQVVEVSLYRRLLNANLGFGKLLSEEQNTDMVLNLTGRQISVHRMVLQARFPNFADKLQKEMKDSKNGEIDIDVKDQDAFSAVISYVYTGELQGIYSKDDECPFRKVIAVYRIARKYELHELGKLCVSYLEKDLSVAGVGDVIVMATRYGESALKEAAKEFFVKNASLILKTAEWELFKRYHPDHFLELLECVMKGSA